MLVVSSQAARADEVALDLRACPVPVPGEVRQLLSLELRERLLPEETSPSADARQVRVVCEASVARVSVLPGPERMVSLERVQPDLQARVLALSIAELLQQTSVHAATPRIAEPVAAPASPPLPVARREGPVTSQRFALWAGAELGATPLWALGASLQFRVRVAKAVAWTSALSFTQGKREIDRGALRVQNIALRTGPAFSYERGRATLLAGVGARIGAWLLRGQPADRDLTRGLTFRSAYVGPALFAGASVRLGEHTLVALELELAHTMRRIEADVVGGGAATLGSWRSCAVLGAGAAW